VTDYRFIDKDPVIDVIRTEAQRRGNLSKEQLKRLAYDSGVSVTTLDNWFSGQTRKPLSLSTRMVLEALDVKIVYERGDGTSIRQPGLEFKPKKEQDEIRRRDKEAGRWTPDAA
jgi:hypothetical protein